MTHKDLGFRINTAFPAQHKGDSFDGCPFVPPGLPAGVSYGIDVTGSVHANLDLGADVTFSYDKAGVAAGANLPVNITYTPTGGSLHVSMPVNIRVEGCVVECFPVPDLCGHVDIPCTFEVGPSNFVAPLTGDAPVVVPITSCTVSLIIPGVITVGSAHVEGNITLTPVPAGGLALGGAVAAYSVSGPASGSIIPVLEWDNAGQTVPANVALDNPLPGSADVTVSLSPVVHWLATSADLKLVIILGNVFHDLGLSDPSPISLFSGNLGPIYTEVGLDTQVSNAVVAAVGFDPGFGAAIAAGKIPVPLLDPELAPLNPGGIPTLGRIDFKFNTDVTPPVTLASLNPAPEPCGWNNSSVIVTLSSSDPAGGSGVESITYSASGAQPIALTTVAASAVAINITQPGITTISFHAEDHQNNVESTHEVTVRIDVTNPSIAIVQPAAANYTHAATLTLDYSVSDAGGSGLTGFTPKIDGSTTLAGHGLASGQAISLLTELALGSHTFSIDATDCATNATHSEVTFTIIVTPESIKEDIDVLVAGGLITKGANSLLAKLNAAADAVAKGKCKEAINNWEAFIHEVEAQSGKGIDPTAADILIADAQYLIDHCASLLASNAGPVGSVGASDPGVTSTRGGPAGLAGQEPAIGAPGLSFARGQELLAWPSPYRGGNLNVAFAASDDGARASTVRIFDLAGRLVRDLGSTPYAPGYRVATWDGNDSRGERVGKGIYFIRAGALGGERILRLAVIR